MSNRRVPAEERFLRICNKRRVQVQIRRYRNESGRQVELIAMSHLGTPEFYAAVHRRLITLQADGFAVLAEGTMWRRAAGRGAPAQGPVTEQEKEFLETWERFRELATVRARQYGLRYQAEAMIPDDSWTLADLDAVELYRAHPRPAVLTARTARMVSQLTWDRFSRAKPLIFAFVTGLSFQLAASGRRRVDPVIDVRRNEHLKNQIDATIGDVAVPWGALHMTEIARHLVGAGFFLVAAEWVDALTLPLKSAVESSASAPRGW